MSAEQPSGPERELSSEGNYDAWRATAFAEPPRSPKPWITMVLVALNVSVFAAMVAGGVGILSPTVDALIKWGANYGPRTTSGQGWRLITNAFIHIGLLHLAMNMIGLWQIGPLVERLFGKPLFLAGYMVAGVCGSLASVAWNPSVVSAGASGAVFGVYGMLCGYLLRNRRTIPREVLGRLQRGALFFIGLNVVYGMQVKGIDMAAHVGGLLGGFAAGVGVAPVRRGTLRPFLLTAAGVAVAALVLALLPRAVDFQQEMEAFERAEKKSVDAYNDAVKEKQAHGVSDEMLAAVIERDVLPPWREFQRRLRSIGHLPHAQAKIAENVGRYMAIREKAWAMSAEALRTGDSAMAARAQALHGDAEKLLKELGGPSIREGP